MRTPLRFRLLLALSAAVLVATGLTALLLAQSTCVPTPNLGLCQPPRGTLDWDQLLNANFAIIDADTINITGGTQSKTGTLNLGGLGLTNLTSGAVPVIGASGVVTQDAANFSYDTTNHRLGIGTNAPNAALHVNGTARVTGFAMATGASSGYILTSDGSGAGTWQANAGGGGGAGGFTDGGAVVYLTTLADKLSLIGTSATEKLEVGGGVALAAASGATPAAGVMEWDGTNFRGYTGSTWKNLDEAGGGGGGGSGGWDDNGTTVTLTTATDDVGIGAAGSSSYKLGVTAETNQVALALGQSLTGSSAVSLIDGAYTWNTSGVPTLVRFLLTNTASGAGSKLLDFVVDGTSLFGVSVTGQLTSATGATFDYETTAAAGTGLQLYRGSGSVARTDVWKAYNDTGIFKVKKDATSDQLWLQTGGWLTVRGSSPCLGFDAAVDWNICYNSGYLRVATGLPGSVGGETFRIESGLITTFAPLATSGGVGSNLLPTLTDTYDLGSPLKLWNQGFISNLNAVIFAEQTLSLVGGWFSIRPNQGTFASAVGTGSTTINFGQTMVVGSFVEVRGYDTSSVLRAEYLQVGSLVSGTTYNVTRGLNGVTAAWAIGTVYGVNGVSGNGRIDLNAYDTPRISLLTQGATYNSQTEIARIGDINGMPGVSTETYGLYFGDASAYLKYAAGVLTIAGNGSGLTSINGGNIQTGTVTATQISGGTITADKLNVSTLSAIAANLGTVTAGTVTGVTGTFGSVTLDSNGIRIAAATGGAQDTTRAYRFTGAGANTGLFYWESASAAELETYVSTNKTTTYNQLTAVNTSGTGNAYVRAEATGSAAQITLTASGSGGISAGTINLNAGQVNPLTDGVVTLGDSTHKYLTAYFSLTAATSSFSAVATKADGALYYVSGFSGCLGGQTVIGGIVTATGC